MFIDSHCHLDFSCFDESRELLLGSLQSHNISHVVIPGTQRGSWQHIVTMAETYPTVYFALGIHPHCLSDFIEQDLADLKALLSQLKLQKNTRCIALGEIGLDKNVNIDVELQERVFLAQLYIAQALSLPVILHVVKTQSRVLQLLKDIGFQYGGVYHAFSGSEAIANEFIKLGFKLGVGGVITRPSAKKTCLTLSKLPLDALVLETDAPDMPIYQQSEALNTPLNLGVIFNQLCELRSEPAHLIEQCLYRNTNSIFSISHD